MGGCHRDGIVAGITGIVKVSVLVRGAVISVGDTDVLLVVSWVSHDR